MRFVDLEKTVIQDATLLLFLQLFSCLYIRNESWIHTDTAIFNFPNFPWLDRPVGLNVSTSKSEAMVLCNSGSLPLGWKSLGAPIEVVNQFFVLFRSEGTMKHEIERQSPLGYSGRR